MFLLFSPRFRWGGSCCGGRSVFASAGLQLSSGPSGLTALDVDRDAGADHTAVLFCQIRIESRSTDVPVRTMPRKGIGPAVASLCSPAETKPAIVIVDGEQRRKAKKWASSDIVTFAACYLHVERSPRQASAQQSVWVQSKGFRSQQTTHQPYHVCNSPGKLLRTRRQSQHRQSSRNNCSASAML